MNKTTVLITGVAGLLGAKLADWIDKRIPNVEIIGIDSLFGGYVENINPNVIFYKHDLATDDIRYIFEKHKPDYVFHFAAYAAEGLSPFMRKFNYSNNMVSTANIVNECIRFDVKRLVYTSSMSVYGHGKGDGTIFDENDIPAPIDPYGVSKYACERDIQIAGEQHGLDWCIIRPHNIYGDKQNIWDSYRNVLGIWIYKIIHNEPMLIYGDGEQKRAFTFVEDNLPCLWFAATRKAASKQIINLGGKVPFTINEASETLASVARAYGYKPRSEHKEARHEVKHAVPTWQKSEDILSFVHNTSLAEGLDKMFNWALQQPERERYRWNNYELDKGIYSYWK